MAPSWLLTQVLIGVAKVLPKQKLVPMNDFTEKAFRDKKKIPLVIFFLFITHITINLTSNDSKTLTALYFIFPYFPLTVVDV